VTAIGEGDGGTGGVSDPRNTLATEHERAALQLPGASCPDSANQVGPGRDLGTICRCTIVDVDGIHVDGQSGGSIQTRNPGELLDDEAAGPIEFGAALCVHPDAPEAEQLHLMRPRAGTRLGAEAPRVGFRRAEPQLVPCVAGDQGVT